MNQFKGTVINNCC